MPKCTSIEGLIPTMLEVIETEGTDTSTEVWASNGRWKAYLGTPYPKVVDWVRFPRSIIVRHHNTNMLAFRLHYPTVVALHGGWSSQTDKQGIGKVLHSAGLGDWNYRRVFNTNGQLPYQWHVPESRVWLAHGGKRLQDRLGREVEAIVEAEPLPEPEIGLGRWVPPLRASDTII